MVKTQVYFREDELAALHAEARRTGRSLASLIREAVQERWLRSAAAAGPVAVWRGPVRLQSTEHDRIYDRP